MMRRHRGSTLVFALIALAAMSLAALALVRAVDGGGSVLGNVGHEQTARAGADVGIEAAVAWLQANAALLDADQPAVYLAAAPANLDPFGSRASSTARAVIDWDDNGCRAAGTVSVCLEPSEEKPVDPGNPALPSYRYFIARLCSAAGPGDAPGNSCLRVATLAPSLTADHGSVDYAHPGPDEGPRPPYYRILVRVTGVRSTASLVEATIHF